VDVSRDKGNRRPAYRLDMVGKGYKKRSRQCCRNYAV
jgi:hypothetical protein